MKTRNFVINNIKKIADDGGADRWFCIIKAPRFDTEGNVIGIIGIFQEVVEMNEPGETFEKTQNQ